MLYTTNIIKYPFTSILSPKPSKFTIDYIQNHDYKWISNNSLNYDCYGNSLLNFDSQNQKVLFSGLIDNPDKRFVKIKFNITVRFNNGFQFDIAETTVLFSYKHLAISKKLKISNVRVRKFQFQPYLDEIYLNMSLIDNSNKNQDNVKLSFENLGFDLVSIN